MNNRRGDGSVYSTGVMPRTHGLLPVSAADEMHVEQVIDADTQCCTWDARQHWGKYRPQRPLKRYAIRLTNLKITCSSVTNRDVVLSYAFIAATEHILHSLTSWDTLTLTVAPKLAMIGHGRVCRNPPPLKKFQNRLCHRCFVCVTVGWVHSSLISRCSASQPQTSASDRTAVGLNRID